MAARMTPLAKALLAISIIGGALTGVWYLGLGDLLQKRTGAAAGGGTEDGQRSPSSKSASSLALGSQANPLKVSIVSFHGYAPALVANGKALKTAPGSLFNELGLNLELVIQDDIPTLATIFESGSAQCAWRTSDFWAQEQPNLRNAGLDARAIMVVDNTQGADAIIVRSADINSVEDLAGKKVALLQYTPSHGMVIDALDSSSLSARSKASVKLVYINADEGTAGVRAAFTSGQVDAAALWDPDLSLALKSVGGAKVIYSTKTATNLIYDVIVCDKRVLDDPKNEPALAALVEGWMKGVEVSRKNPRDAVDALVKTQEFFQLLAKEEGQEFIQSLFDNIVWTGLDDNIRILALAGGTNHYERVYKRFDGIYRAAGALANPKSPVINPSESFDDRYIKTLMVAHQEASVAAKKPQFQFSDEERERVAHNKAALTKPVTVNFATGSAELTKRANRTIDDEMVPLIENNGAAYFEVSGNTDSTGSQNVNLRLSRQRAQAVVSYLIKEWEFPQERFVVTGNGSDRPLCDETKLASEGTSLEDCRARNRATRVAVLGR